MQVDKINIYIPSIMATLTRNDILQGNYSLKETQDALLKLKVFYDPMTELLAPTPKFNPEDAFKKPLSNVITVVVDYLLWTDRKADVSKVRKITKSMTTNMIFTNQSAILNELALSLNLGIHIFGDARGMNSGILTYAESYPEYFNPQDVFGRVASSRESIYIASLPYKVMLLHPARMRVSMFRKNITIAVGNQHCPPDDDFNLQVLVSDIHKHEEDGGDFNIGQANKYMKYMGLFIGNLLQQSKYVSDSSDRYPIFDPDKAHELMVEKKRR